MQKFKYNGKEYEVYAANENNYKYPYVADANTHTQTSDSAMGILKKLLEKNGYDFESIKDLNTQSLCREALKTLERDDSIMEVCDIDFDLIDYFTKTFFGIPFSEDEKKIEGKLKLNDPNFTNRHVEDIRECLKYKNSFQNELKKLSNLLLEPINKNNQLKKTAGYSVTDSGAEFILGTRIKKYIWSKFRVKNAKFKNIYLAYCLQKGSISVQVIGKEIFKLTDMDENHKALLRLLDLPNADGFNYLYRYINSDRKYTDSVSTLIPIKDEIFDLGLSKDFYFENYSDNSLLLKEIIDAFKYLYDYYMYVVDENYEFPLDNIGNFDGEKRKNMDLVNYPNNLILFGPPGTGKTYNSKTYAVAICDNVEVESLTDYDYVQNRYNELVEEKRIGFTTFHQSYGYEEFIEGIAPVIDNETKQITYTPKDGVFKSFCKTNEIIDFPTIKAEAKVWKMSLGDKGRYQRDCFDNNYIRIGFDNTDEYKILNKLNKGDIVLILKTHTSINGIAIVEDDELFELPNATEYKHARKVKWLLTDKEIEFRNTYNNGTYLANYTLTRLSITPNVVKEILKDNLDDYSKIPNETKDIDNKNKVFIIDEINRGNISKIFGELITLIEPSKRLGAKEGMEAILPYSKEKFGVPSNVYILGTMNTADRSIALMDTALRRRFDFIEMLPKPNVLSDIVVEGLEINNLLEVINKRIEVLYDREHTIGHAYFMPLREDNRLENLSKIFKNRIMPLLQEYFYEDYEKIRLILGDEGKDEAYQFIKKISNDTNVFKNNVSLDEIPEFRYEINEEAFNHIESYNKII